MFSICDYRRWVVWLLLSTQHSVLFLLSTQPSALKVRLPILGALDAGGGSQRQLGLGTTKARRRTNRFLRFERQDHRDGRALASHTVDAQVAVEQFGALTHVDHPQAGARFVVLLN